MIEKSPPNKYTANIRLSYILYEVGEKPEQTSIPITTDNKSFSLDINKDTKLEAIKEIRTICQSFMQNSNQAQIASLINKQQTLEKKPEQEV